MGYELLLRILVDSPVSPMNYEFLCEISLESHESAMSYELSWDTLVLISSHMGCP